MSFKVCVSLLIFCLADLAIVVSAVLKSPTIIVLLLTSSFILVSVCLTYCGAPTLGAYIFIIVIFSSWIDPWSGLSVFWRSVVPFYCGGFTQWVGLDDWLVKVSCLGKLASVFWCMELDFFSLECNGVPSNEL